MLVQKKVSKVSLAFLAVIAYLLYGIMNASAQFNPWHKSKIKAAEIMQEATQLIKEEAKARGVVIDSRFDPNETGLVGPQESPIVTDRGLLDAKLMTTNPNFAAVVTDMLNRAGVKEGEQVAVSYTGSMPGANLAVLSACKALNIHPVIISSIGASNWGATDPRFTWLDMEQFLIDKGVFRYGSKAASLGGYSDTASNLDKASINMLRDAIRRNKIPYIYTDTVEESIAERIQIYNSLSDGEPFKAYINVGGGIVSLGAGSNGELMKQGLNKSIDVSRFYPRGIMIHMAEQNIPIIHLLNIRDIVTDYGLPQFPAPLPEIGEGGVFAKNRYNLKVTLIFTLILLVVLTVVIELDLYVAPGLVKKYGPQIRKAMRFR